MERAKILEDHLKNVQSELFQTQRLVEAKDKEIATENHLKMLAEREIGRLESEVKKIDVAAAEIQEQTDMVQSDIFRANEKMDKFKAKMNFNQEELEQWTLAEQQKEDDFLALEKYRRQDEAKIKQMNLEIEKLNHSVLEKKRELQDLITETQSAQIELDKTAEDFKTLHKERQALVQQWEEAIEAMNRRDEMIQKAGEKFAVHKQMYQEKKEQMFQESEHLKTHVKNNRQLDAQIQVINRIVEKQREDYNSQEKYLNELNDELEVIRNTLAKASTELNSKRNYNKELQANLKDKFAKLDHLVEGKAASIEEIKNNEKMLGDLEMQSKYIYSVQQDLDSQLKQLDRRLDELKTNQYKQSQLLFRAKQEEANLVASISGTHAQNRNMSSKIAQMDQEAFKQQELLYNIEFQIQQMERKVNRAQGERTEEEKEILNQRIKELQSELNDLEDEQNMLGKECKKIQSEVRTMKREVEKKEQERVLLEEKVHDLGLENESHESEYKLIQKMKEESLVQRDVQKLQVNRLRDVLRSRADEVSGLENRKFQLDMAYLEKEEQIKAHKDYLSSQLKSVMEERRKLGLELSERRVYIDKLKNKFNIMVQRLTPATEDGTVVEDQEQISQAQFLIRAIQEREELQREGDVLDQEIQKLEAQDRALDMTLQMFKKTNSNHLENYKQVSKEQHAQHNQKKTELEKKARELDAMMSKRIEERNLYADQAQQSNQQLQILMAQQREVEAKSEVLRVSQKQIDSEIQKLSTSMKTQETLMRNQIQEIKKKMAKNKDESTVLKAQVRDIDIVDLKMRNINALKCLEMVVKEDLAMASTLERLLAENGIVIPKSPLPSARSSSSRLSTSRLSSSRLSHTNSARSIRSSGSSNGSRTSLTSVELKL